MGARVIGMNCGGSVHHSKRRSKEEGRKEGRKRAEGEGKRGEDDLVGKERRKGCREIERERERDARVRTTVVQRANNRYSQVFFSSSQE